jgi:hypothetical protein
LNDKVQVEVVGELDGYEDDDVVDETLEEEG